MRSSFPGTALPVVGRASGIRERVMSLLAPTLRFARTGVAVGAFVLAGCVDSTSGLSVQPEIPRTTPLPADLQKDLLDAALANTIVENCRGILRLNRSAVGELRVRAEAESKRRGLRNATQDEVFALVGGERLVQDLVFGYVQKRRILVTQPSSWCAAGNRELAEKTAISRYLL